MYNEQEFEILVTQAIEELPGQFRERMQNITIQIEDLPNKSILRRMGIKSPYSLLGLYQGVPVTRRGIHYRNVMPDRITIFRKPILKRFQKNTHQIKNEIKRVVLHEIGHYFGLNDHELYIIEKQKINRERQKNK